MRSRAHVLIYGIVQGVSFRYHTRQKALSRHVSGWVRNLPDGRVEAVLEGEKTDVKSLLESLQRGPAGSRVDRVSAVWESPRGDLEGFEIVG